MRTRRQARGWGHGSETRGEVSWSPAGLDVGLNVSNSTGHVWSVVCVCIHRQEYNFFVCPSACLSVCVS